MPKLLGCIFLLLLSLSANAEIKVREVIESKDVLRSVENYPLCDVHRIAKSLASRFEVVYIIDSLADYNYYLINDRDKRHAKEIEEEICSYINKNKCYLYWGSISSFIYLSIKKTARFGRTGTPSYLISPLVWCNKAGYN